MRSLVLFLAVLVIAAACGIKAPPKPPLEAVSEGAAPDAGCCGARP